MRTGLPPPFHDIGEYKFQDLCRELLAGEPEIVLCDHYGKRGQGQLGIDLKGQLAGGAGLHIAQCKCYASLQPSDIVAASDKFLKHVAIWTKRGARRFLFIAACDMSDTRLQDTIDAQRARFAESELDYGAWSAWTLRDKLRGRQDLVEKYFPMNAAYWVREICGESFLAAGSSESGSRSVQLLAAEVDGLASALSNQVSVSLASMRNAVREGRRDEAVTWINAIRAEDAQWDALTPATQAAVLRFHALLILEEAKGIERAKVLVAEARAKAPDTPARVEALIARHERGADEALGMLKDASDADSVNMRAGLLLELGRIDEALRLLPRGDEGDAGAEALRLRALALLSRRDPQQALVEAREALKRRPTWLSTRFTAAVVEFYAALSPAALPLKLPAWPEPVAWGLVKRDDESLSRLRRGAEEFAALAALPEIAGYDKNDLDCWHLACLACDVQSQSQAESLARALLHRNPSAFRILFWALTRRYEFDRAVTVKAIEHLARSRGAPVNSVIALAACLIDGNHSDQALIVLQKYRRRFAIEAPSLWRFWMVQALIRSGNVGAARRLLRRSRGIDGIERVQEVVAHATADEGGGVSELIGVLEKRRAAREPAVLFEEATVLASSGSWEFAADNAEALISQIGTSESARLACRALHHEHRYEACLALIDRTRSFFTGSVVPLDLRALRIDCAVHLGLVAQAVREAEDFARDDPSTATLLSLFRLYLLKADGRSAAAVAQRLLSRPDLKPEDALSLAGNICFEDLAMARLLWYVALRRGLASDEAVVRAYVLAFRLGLETELPSLRKRFEDVVANRPDLVRAGLSIDDLIVEMEKLRQCHDERQTAYTNGGLPAHLLLPMLGWSLAELYHSWPAKAEREGTFLRTPTLLRHGRLGSLKERALPRGTTIVTDITALLTAAHLDVLDAVESAFSPLRIALALPATLVHLCDKAGPPQPSREAAVRQVSELLARGSILVAEKEGPARAVANGAADEAWLEWAVAFVSQDGGLIVDFLRRPQLTRASNPEPLAELADASLVNCRQLIDRLRQEGSLSSATYDAALASLGVEGSHTPMGRVPTVGCRLLLAPNIAEELANAQVLRDVCRVFRVFIEPEEATSVSIEVRGFDDRRRLVSWLETLTERVRRGIENGTYEILPEPRLEPVPNEGTALPPEALGLRSILMPHGPDSILWCDDRFLTAYESAGGVPIVTTVGVLNALRENGTLGLPQYYGALLKLRAGNVRFLALDIDELSYHLANARTDGGALVETNELRVLRRSYAASLMHGEMLQQAGAPPGSNTDAGEMPFLVASMRAVFEAILTNWQVPGLQSGDREARAEWLVSAFLTDYLPFLPLAKSGDSQLLAFTLASMMAQALKLNHDQSGAEYNDRRTYLDWLDRSLLQPALRREPLLAVAIGGFLKGFLQVPEASDGADEAYRAAAGRFIRDLVEEFPEPIREELWRDEAFAALLGARQVSLLVLGALRFERIEFFQAAEAAFRGTQAQVRDLETGHWLPLEADISSQPPRLLIDRGGQEMCVQDEVNRLLLADGSEHERALRAHPEWFDLPQREMEQAISRILICQQPGDRVQAAEEVRESSAAWHYLELQRRLAMRKAVDLRGFVGAGLGSVLRHLRLPLDLGGRGFGEIWEDAAAHLLLDVGIKETMRRCASLPVPLPRVLGEALAAAPAQEKADLLAECFPVGSSPLGVLHGLALSLPAANESDELRREADRLLSILARADFVEEAGTLLSVVAWAHGALLSEVEAAALPVALQLAAVWSHADATFTLLPAKAGKLEQIRQYFSQAGRLRLDELFVRDKSVWVDVTHHHRVAPLAMILYGLSYATAGTSLETKNRVAAALEGVLPDDVDLVLLADNRLGGNALGSFLGNDASVSLIPLVGEKTAACASNERRLEVVSEALDRLAADAASADAWLLLFGILGDREPDIGTRKALAEVIPRLPAGWRSDWSDAEKERMLFSLLVAATQAAHVGGTAVDDLTAKILLVAQRITANDLSAGGGFLSASQPHILLDCCLAICVRPAQPDISASRFAGLVGRIADAAPSLAPAACGLVASMCQRLPMRISKHLWPLLERLRAMA